MKKNLLSIVILALLIVNIVLTSIMMFSVMSASEKSAKLVTDIAKVMKLELGDPEEEKEAIPLSQTEVYQFTDPMTIELQKSEDGSAHYCLVSIALSMNTKDKGYKESGSAATMATYEPLMSSEITSIIGSYTIDALREPAAQEEARGKILGAIQELFVSEFVYNVSFSDIKFQ